MSNVYITSITTTSAVDPGFNIYLIDATNNNITLTLPSITSDGFYFMFRRIDTASSNTVTLEGDDPVNETIDNLQSISFAPGDELAVASLNNVWWRL